MAGLTFSPLRQAKLGRARSENSKLASISPFWGYLLVRIAGQMPHGDLRRSVFGAAQEMGMKMMLWGARLVAGGFGSVPWLAVA